MSRLEGFIERFEDEEAVILKSDRTVDSVERCELPPNAHEGDFIVEADDGKSFRIDYIITELRRLEIRRMSDAFFD